MARKITATVFMLLTISCRHPAESSENKIVNGLVVAKDNWLARVVVAITDDKYFKFGSSYCSGTVIAKNAILTAAHCMENTTDGAAEWVVWGPKINSEVSFRRKVIKRVRHADASAPAREGRYPFNDLAIYFFEGDLPANAAVVKMLSPVVAYERGVEFQIAGFGVTSVHHAIPKGVLTWAHVYLREEDKRKKELELSGSRDQDTCFGDSGGPAFVRLEGDTQHLLAGITSWGDEDCRGSGYYVDLRYYQSAIDDLVALGK